MHHIGPFLLDDKEITSLVIGAFGALAGLFGLIKRILDMKDGKAAEQRRNEEFEQKVSSSTSVVELVASFQGEITEERKKADAAELEKSNLQRLFDELEVRAKREQEETRRDLATAVFLSSQHEALFRNCPLPIVVTNSDGRITEWNPAAERVFGWTYKEAVGMPAVIIVPPEYEDAHNRGINRIRLKQPLHLMGLPLRVKAMKKGGETFDCHITLTSWQDTNEGEWVAAFVIENCEEAGKTTQISGIDAVDVDAIGLTTGKTERGKVTKEILNAAIQDKRTDGHFPVSPELMQEGE